MLLVHFLDFKNHFNNDELYIFGLEIVEGLNSDLV